LSPKKSTTKKSAPGGRVSASATKKLAPPKSTGKKVAAKNASATKASAKKPATKPATKPGTKPATKRAVAGKASAGGQSLAKAKSPSKSAKRAPGQAASKTTAADKKSKLGPKTQASLKTKTTVKQKPAGKASQPASNKPGSKTKSPALKKDLIPKTAAKKGTSPEGVAHKPKLAKSTAVTAPLVAKSSPRKASNGNSNGNDPHSVSSSTTASRPLKKTSSPGGDYDKFRQLLLAVRQRLQGDVSMMSREALGGSDGAADNHAPIHPAEVGTHSFEQEFTLNLLSSDGDRLDRIDAALEKIGDGTYGACDECGCRIPRARLEVIPDTPFCVKCATRLEL
jgi:DnaK suppressor protein